MCVTHNRNSVIINGLPWTSDQFSSLCQSLDQCWLLWFICKIAPSFKPPLSNDFSSVTSLSVYCILQGWLNFRLGLTITSSLSTTSTTAPVQEHVLIHWRVLFWVKDRVVASRRDGATEWGFTAIKDRKGKGLLTGKRKAGERQSVNCFQAQETKINQEQRRETFLQVLPEKEALYPERLWVRLKHLELCPAGYKEMGGLTQGTCSGGNAKCLVLMVYRQWAP